MSGQISQDTVVDGRYRMVGRIGTGGMADVWCAEDLQLGRQVALKMLHSRFAEDREFVERFRREASSAAGLQHPNVVGVYDRGEWDGTSYIAMELVQGETLKQLILREAPIEPERAIDLTSQILRAARFAHKRGIIHRDLKPHNVIVDGEGRAKVTDFGIARAGASDMTETGSIMGTAQYLSPEQAQGHAVSAQSDLYAVGIVLYELLTGHLPFDGDTPVTIALKQVSEDPAPPSQSNPSITPDLEHAVMRALAKDPAQRFADADEFIAALEAARTTLNEPQGQATTAFMPVGAVPVEEEEVVLAEEEERRRRPRWWLWALLAALAIAGAIAAVVLFAGPEEREVPRVVGVNASAAAQALRNEGFKPVIQRVRNDAPRDEVIAQEPAPGTELEVGDEVSLTVSDGPGNAAVPDVAGLTRAKARERVRDAGFKVRERMSPSDAVAEGRVIRTLPSIGSQVEIGETVTLVVSSGPEQVTVPDVTGDDVEDARSSLEQVGLDVTVAEAESASARAGTVLSQTPAGGASVEEGTTVTITVATESDDVTVPTVTGRSEQAAVSALSGAGLEVNVTEEPVDRPSQDGKVLGQSPAGGGSVRSGSRVTITVGRFNPDLDPDPGGGEEDPPDDGGDGTGGTEGMGDAGGTG